MAFCPNCGAQVEGRFCAKCGSAVTAASPSTPPPPGPSAGQAYVPPGQGYVPPAGVPPGQGYGAPVGAPAATPMADNVAGALCYVLGLITGVIFLVIAPYNQNRNVRFHAFQSIFLNVAIIVLDIAMGLVFSVLFRIIGWWIAALVWPIFGLFCLFVWLMMMFQTYQGKTIVLPVIGQLARQQA
jgi:uncharacterized membrane protein